mmetsp:Transcript_80806/g.142407  ORF Transcript_80806/g.142407 Transcript_80806/m.142407 type:complete len:580 (+) Transcript_80806:219-1958(+)
MNFSLMRNFGVHFATDETFLQLFTRIHLDGCLQLLVEVLQTRNLRLQTLALARLEDNRTRRAAAVKGITREDLPVVKHALREGLSSSVLAKVTSETEGLLHRQVGLDVVDGSTGTVLLTLDNTTTLVQHGVDTAHARLNSLDLNQEDRLHHPGLASQLAGIEVATSGGDHLSTTTVDSISVHSQILQVPTHTTHVLIAHDTFLGGPLPGSNEGILDFGQIGNTLGLVGDDVGTRGIRTEAPNLTSISNVPLVLVSQIAATSLGVVLGRNLAVVNVSAQLIAQGLSLTEDTVVLIGRLGQADHISSNGDGLTERHNGLRDAKLDTHEVLLQILQANLQVQLTSTSNNVLTGFLDGGLHQRIGLGQTLQTLDQLRQIGRILGLDGDTHDRGDTVLHVLQRVGVLGALVSDGGSLDDELVNTEQTNQVTARNILDRLLVATHHKHGTLDALSGNVGLATVLVVGSHDPGLLASAHGTGEDTTEGDETALISGWHHLGDIQAHRALGVAITDGLEVPVTLVTNRSSVQSLGTILLGLGWGRQVVDHHHQQSIRGGQPLLHDGLQQLLTVQILVIGSQLDAQGR